MYRLNLKGTPYEMGKQLGAFFKKHRTTFPLKLNRRQVEHGHTSIRLLKKYYPEAEEEIRGITDTIKHDHTLFASWMMCMGCCLIIRQNHNVEVRGCTAFSFIMDNSIYYGRDNDLPPYLKPVSKSILYSPANKNRFILNTSSFVNGEEGINEHGLAAAMTFVVPKRDEITPGLNSVFLVRYILENCKNVKEGTKALQSLPIASSCNILLCDRSGKMAVMECNPAAINIRHPEKNENGEDFIVTVNHFTSDKMSQHDASRKNVYSSKKRYETAYNALMKNSGNDPVRYAQDILSGKHGFMCQYKKTIKFETIWSSVFDITHKRVYIAGGDPQETRFIEDRRLAPHIK